MIFRLKNARDLKHNSRFGLSLIETAIVLGVVGLVIGGIWVAAVAVRENFVANDIAKGFITAMKNTEKLIPSSMASASPVYLQFGSAVTTASTMKIFPDDWIAANGAAVLPTGQALELVVADDVTRGPVAVLQFNAGTSSPFKPSLCMKVIQKMMIGHIYNLSTSFIRVSGVWVSDRNIIQSACLANGNDSINGMNIYIFLSAR